MVVMTAKGEANMYAPRLLGREGFDPKEDFWAPVVGALDDILAG
jgi:hypothetical protein